MNRKREIVNEKAVAIVYPESLDSIEQRMNRLSEGNSFMNSIASSVQEKFKQYGVESEEQRKRMFPKKDSPFKK